MNSSISRLLEKLNSELKDTKPTIDTEATDLPVQTLYGGADRFSEDLPRKMGNIALKMLETYTPNFIEFARAVGIPLHYLDIPEREYLEIIENKSKDNIKFRSQLWIAKEVYSRVIEKLRTQPVEDFRIDFEDGFGYRSDREEDSFAERAAQTLALAMERDSAPPRVGIRIKALNSSTSKRAVRTLYLFLSRLLQTPPHRLPKNFTVTLPKVERAIQTETLAGILTQIEGELNIPSNSIKIDILLESPQLLAPSEPENSLSTIVRAGQGRIWAASLGTYDFTSQFGVSSHFQGHDHPVVDLARAYFRASLAPFGIELVDSVTTEIPITPNRPSHDGQLSLNLWAENLEVISKAWKIHFKNVFHSLKFGIYWGWDLHPGQLPIRYAALYYFFLSNYSEAAERMRNFINQQTRSTLSGSIFDDAASAAGLINFFYRAYLCGALSKEELQSAGIDEPQLLSSPLKFIQSLKR